MTSDKRKIELLKKYAEGHGMTLEELGMKIESSLVNDNDNELQRRTPEEIEALFKKPKEEVTIEGYVARDNGGGLYLHREKPFRRSLEWHTHFGYPRNLPQDSFPSVTWESEPKRVKITITPI